MHVSRGLLLLALCLWFGIAMADVVTDWNAIAKEATYQQHQISMPVARSLAIMHVAMFDAVNSVYGTYQPYHIKVPVNGSVSAEAAAVAAAFQVMMSIYPGQAAYFTGQYADSLAAIPDGDAKIAGIQLGETVAASILELRSTDNSDADVPYTPGTQPGEWRPTPPDFSPALFPQYAIVTPFVLPHPWTFRPGPPPALDSMLYAVDFLTVKKYGRDTSRYRTAKQTETAFFWGENPDTESSAALWNDFARDVADQKQRGLLENARIFALLNMALLDAIVATWDAKYKYNFWRPVTAIRETSFTPVGHVPGDPTWLPLLATTPSFPEYPSGHATFSMAAAMILASAFGNNVTFSGHSHTDPSIIHTYTSFTQATAETAISRLFGGVHYKFSLNVGRRLGAQIGEYVWEHALQPVGQDPLPGLTGQDINTGAF